ncbi:MAG: hypothetical protein AB1589_21550 [Cyanobacteriota bacterium]
MQKNKTPQTPKENRPTPPARTPFMPLYIDEDPELTPERWWMRRQKQSLTGL